MCEFTVLPYEYSDVPLYHISDGESINCYTGKNSNSTYIYSKTVEETDYFSFLFNGIQPKNYIIFYQCVSFLTEDKRVNIHNYVNHRSPYTKMKSGTLKI